jgi:hypothetical protein
MKRTASTLLLLITVLVSTQDTLAGEREEIEATEAYGRSSSIHLQQTLRMRHSPPLILAQGTAQRLSARYVGNDRGRTCYMAKLQLRCGADLIIEERCDCTYSSSGMWLCIAEGTCYSE